MHLGIRLLLAVIVPLGICRRALRKKSLDFSGVISAFVVGFFVTLSSFCHFAVLLAFFVSSSKLTNFNAHVKKRRDNTYKEGGQRNYVQVLCNGLIPTIFSIIYMVESTYGERPVNFAEDLNSSVISMIVIGAFSSSCGDTWSSEIGEGLETAIPRLITTWEKVPVGTNGGVTVIGTVASILGGAIVGVSYYLTLSLTAPRTLLQSSPVQWPVIVVCCLAGFLGSLFDSFLGATMQYSGYCEETKQVVHKPTPKSKLISGTDFLDNNAVNLLSNTAVAFVTPVIAYMIWKPVT